MKALPGARQRNTKAENKEQALPSGNSQANEESRFKKKKQQNQKQYQNAEYYRSSEEENLT